MSIIKTIFCANDQVETPHFLSSSPSGEIQAVCSVCGRTLKFPAGLTREEFNAQVEQHKVDNEGQVSVDSIDANLKALSDDPEATEDQPAEPEVTE